MKSNLITQEEKEKALGGPLSPDQEERWEYWHGEVARIVKEDGMPPRYLEKENPGKAVAVLMMLEQCMSQSKIMEKVAVNPNTIIKIRTRHSASLQERRKEFSRNMAVITDMGSNLIMKKMQILDEDDEALKETPLKDIALTMAIAMDKGAMCDGMATVKIEHVRGPSLKDAQEAINAAREAIAQRIGSQCIDAEVIEG